MNKRILSVTLCLIIILCLLPTKSMASPIYTYDSTHTNGEIIVHVLRDSNWQEAGKLSYGRFIQEKKLEILELESSKGFVKLKL
ncbi:MAG: hypothetical protein WDA24_11675, partial [Tissierellales bacterium]